MYRIEKCLDEIVAKYDDEILEVSQNRIEISALAGELPEGTVCVRSRSGREMRVFFYSNHYRMQCRVDSFYGKEGTLSYRFDTTGLEVGGVEKGNLCILSEAGEYQIPFSVSIRQPLAETSLGEIRNLFHFANLAREHWDEAVSLFYSEEFRLLFNGHDRKYFDLYRGLSAHPGNIHNVDEFLVAIHKKSKNTYTVREEGLLLKQVQDGQQESVTVVCDGWGYIHADVSAKGEFLELTETSISNENFEDGICQLSFTIRTGWLKPGSNIGAIVLSYEGGSTEIPVIVEVSSVVSRKVEEGRETRRLMAQLLRDYIAYAVGKEPRENSLKEAEITIEKLNQRYGRNLFARLCQMHIFIEEGRDGDAAWVLSHIEKTQRQEEMEPAHYGYYLYVRSLLEKKESFTRSAREQLAELHRKYPEDMFLTCLYARMFCDTLGEQGRLMLYKKQYDAGSRNPILYLEAFSVYEESLVHLSVLDEFEISVLRFAQKYGLYTVQIAQRLTELVMRKKEMTQPLFSLLCQCYESIPEDQMLHALCTLMVRSGMCGPETFKWYERAVQRQLRITSLYEYYMMSADTSVDILLPRSVLMYFAYHCELDEKRKSYLFALLVRHREEIPELFRRYEDKIEEFAMKQINKGTISENLAVLYRYFLQREGQKIPMDKMQKIAFRHLIKVHAKQAVNVIVVQDKMRAETVYPIEKQRAYVDCYTADYAVLLEDMYGNRYCALDMWTDVKLMSVEKLALYLQDQEAQNIGYLLYRNYIGGGFEQDRETLLPIYEMLALSEEIDCEYRHELCGILLKFYFEEEQYEKMEPLLSVYDMKRATARERAEVVRYLVYMEQDDRALGILLDYGFEQVPVKSLTRLISRCLQKEKGFVDTQMALVYYTFCRGKYTPDMLRYLCRYFEGSMKQMRDVWKACISFDVDASAVAERILQAYLFSHGYLSDLGEVFWYYVKHNKRERVVKAYISDMTYRYFVRQQLAQPYVFKVLEDMLSAGNEMDDVSRMAYLYYMATEQKDYGERQKALITTLVNSVITDKQYVPFLEGFAEFIPWLIPYTELTYLEYRTVPGRKVTLHFLREGQEDKYCHIKLDEICEGYYCHNFVLFFGEQLPYYFMEHCGGEQFLTESGCLEKSDMTGEDGESRYGLLNDIIMSDALGDERTKRELTQRYEYKAYLSQKLFGDK